MSLVSFTINSDVNYHAKPLLLRFGFTLYLKLLMKYGKKNQEDESLTKESEGHFNAKSACFCITYSI